MANTTIVTQQPSSSTPQRPGDSRQINSQAGSVKHKTLQNFGLPGLPAESTTISTDSIQQTLASLAQKHGGKVEIVDAKPRWEFATMVLRDQIHEFRTHYSKSLIVSFMNGVVTLKVADAKGIELSGRKSAVAISQDLRLELGLAMSNIDISSPTNTTEDLKRASAPAIEGIGSAINSWRKLGKPRFKINEKQHPNITWSNTLLDKFLVELDISKLYTTSYLYTAYQAEQPKPGELLYRIKPEQNFARSLLDRAIGRSAPELTLLINSATDKHVQLQIAINGVSIESPKSLSHKDAAIFTRAFLMALSQIYDYSTRPK